MFAGLMRRESISPQSITNIRGEKKETQDKCEQRLKWPILGIRVSLDFRKEMS